MDHGNLRGVGIQKIEQISSSTDSLGANVIRVTLDDDSFYDYTVRNGDRGPAGSIWIGTSAPPDDSYSIWLNPSGMVSGYVGANQGAENAGRVLAVGEDGVVIPREETPYTLPQASSDALGGVKADAVEATDTQPVRIGGDGKLYTAPGGDTSIGITGASAGQIPKVKAVDESGAPTEWKAEKDTTPFIVTIGGDEYSGYTSSHTFDEIAAASSAGRVVMAYTDYIDFPQVSQSLYGVYFDLISTQDTAIFVYIDPLNMIKYTFAVDPFSISASASYLSATSSTFGGVKADSAEATDTQPVRIGGDGKLYTAPGSGGGADISLGISGATAGQMAKVKAVDENGVPTQWEAGSDALPLLYHGKVSEAISGFEITEIGGNPMSLSEVNVRAVFKVSTASWCGIELCTSAKNQDNKLITAEGGYVNATAEKYYLATAHGKISNGNFEINAVQPTQFTPYLNVSSGIKNFASIKSIPNFVYNKPPELQEMNAENGRINTVKIGGNFSEVEVIIWGR